MEVIARKSTGYRDCRAPDCHATALDGGIFCRVCQALLDRVKKELESGPGANRRLDGGTPLPTVQNLDEARAASFDAGLRRRAANKQSLTEAGLLTRAVRIIQLRQAGETDEKIVTKLCLADKDELERDLARYREKVESRASSRIRGIQRDVELDRAIVDRLKTHKGPRTDLAKELGISYSALVSRITRLRRDGHEIPDARRSKVAVAA